MAFETILQHDIFSKFVFPFLLMFFVVFAVLEKTKVLGEQKQTNALVSFVVSLIFVGALSPKMIVSNLILFLSVALIIVFVVLLLWGFVSGGSEIKIESGWLKWVVGIVVVLAVFIAVLWATGVLDSFVNILFKQSWSFGFWTNVLFIAVIAIALALILKKD